MLSDDFFVFIHLVDYCDYPGEIKHGQVLLVGVIGKYEYRHYVKRIGHNEKVEYVCDKGFKRHGHEAATCVNGEWSPKGLPTCDPGQHPKILYIFRGKRSVKSISGQYSILLHKHFENFSIVHELQNANTVVD